jgi:Flp pilus assembly protein TadD
MAEPRTRQAEARPPALPRAAWLALGLGLLAFLAAWWPAGRCGFVNLDDDAYVLGGFVSRGFTAPGVVWTLTSVHSSNWHPLTTFSHMLDVQLFGLNAAPMHWENVLLHLANAALVFAVWRAMTGTFWRAFAVAALFALHPLRVESVAWISERKDVLSTFFWLLGLLAYVRWQRAPSRGRYALVALALVLALLSKPMAVTFPCTLLLLDYWPLARWPRQTWRELGREKWPLFALVVAHSVVTFLVQSGSGAANYAARIPLGERIGNAFVSYARYLGKTVWPETLAPLYFHPGRWPLPVLVGSLALLALVSWLAWRGRETHRWFLVGWLWFLGTLVPVIGLVQVGAQSMADRYSYVPLLGVFTILAWGGAALARARAVAPRTLLAGMAVALAGCTVLTHRQVKTWTDSETLYRHSIAVGEDNPGVRFLLASARAARGAADRELAAHYERALQIEPDYVNALTSLAALALKEQRPDDALALVNRSIACEPRNPALRYNLARINAILGRNDEAERHYEATLQLDPHSAGAHRELAQLCAARHDLAGARRHYEVVAASDRWNAPWLTEYGILLANLGDYAAAGRALERAAWIDPSYAPARQGLTALAQLTARRS